MSQVFSGVCGVMLASNVLLAGAGVLYVLWCRLFVRLGGVVCLVLSWWYRVLIKIQDLQKKARQE
jgi:hypothetical protein